MPGGSNPSALIGGSTTQQYCCVDYLSSPKLRKAISSCVRARGPCAPHCRGLEGQVAVNSLQAGLLYGDPPRHRHLSEERPTRRTVEVNPRGPQVLGNQSACAGKRTCHVHSLFRLPSPPRSPQIESQRLA